MAELIITLPGGREQRFELTKDPADVGRDAHCAIPLDDPSASRRHARFVSAPQGYLIEDLGSKNGILVNDVPCTSRLLKDGDRVQIGATVALFRDSARSTGMVVIADDKTLSHATKYVSKDTQLVLPQQRLEMIYALSDRLTTLQSQERLFENAMDICFETLQFERGAIAVRRRNSRALDWPVVRHLRGAEGELTVSRTLLSRTLEHGERAVFTDRGMADGDPTVSMVQHGIRSALCVPLINGEEVMGIIYGDRVSTSASYSTEDIDFLAGIAQQVSIGLINSRLAQDQERMQQMTRDLELARTIQTALFPKNLPTTDGVYVAALNDPGHGVSGDYYDVITTDDGCLWCIVADVTGEGVAASLLMANLQAAVRVTIGDEEEPGELLSRWNELIFRNTDTSKFITCILVRMDLTSRRLLYASAGHHLPIILGTGSVKPRTLDVDPGFPLGVVEDAVFETAGADMGSDPFGMFCYTDGVIEAMDKDRQMFGGQRLYKALADLGELAPQAMIKQLRKQLSNFAVGTSQSDDITMLAVRIE